jgi:gentisate 1,2-dioxygenase
MSDQLSFDVGLKRIERAVTATGFSASGRVITSRDRDVAAVLSELVIDVPEGFTKAQLPFSFSATQFYVTTCDPGAATEKHVHDGDFIRFVAKGTVVVNDELTLTAGDWMFVPKGVAYSLAVPHKGEQGTAEKAVVVCSYQCCC